MVLFDAGKFDMLVLLKESGVQENSNQLFKE